MDILVDLGWVQVHIISADAKNTAGYNVNKSITN
jgi:hypothetical protein